MKAVVLVGGFGTRLRPLTYNVPKPMLPVGHEPMIVSLVKRLAAGGVTDVVLALGFQPEPFRAAFVDDRLGDCRISYVVEPEPLDTGGAIAFAARQAGIGSTFVVANGDIITDLSIAELINTHRVDGRDATLHLTSVADPSAFGMVELGAGDSIRRFVEKPAPGDAASNLVNAGTYVFEPSVIGMIEPGRRVSIERDVFPRLVAQERIGGHPTEGYWLDTGRPEQYLQANLDLLSGARAHTVPGIHPGAVVAADAVVSNSVIGPGAQVGHAHIQESLILPGARVGHGATVVRSIVAGVVGPDARLVDAVIGEDYEIPTGCEVSDQRCPDPNRTGRLGTSPSSG